MNTKRMLLTVLVVLLLGLMVVSVSAQGDGDKLQTRTQDQLKDGSCLLDSVPDPVCTADCDGVPDQDRIQLRLHWVE